MKPAAVTLLLGLLAGTPVAALPTDPLPMTAAETKAAAEVTTYVRTTRGWSPDSYRIELRQREGQVLIFWVIHNQDEMPSQAAIGGGMSFAVDVNAGNARVLRERKFQ